MTAKITTGAAAQAVATLKTIVGTEPFFLAGIDSLPMPKVQRDIAKMHSWLHAVPVEGGKVVMVA